MTIPLQKFYEIATRCGFTVYRESECFYKIYYEDDRDIGHVMARYFKSYSGTTDELTLFKPKKYSYISPSTIDDDGKNYTDPDEFQTNLLNNLFQMKKYVLEYQERFYTRV